MYLYFIILSTDTRTFDVVWGLSAATRSVDTDRVNERKRKEKEKNKSERLKLFFHSIGSSACVASARTARIKLVNRLQKLFY